MLKTSFRIIASVVAILLTWFCGYTFTPKIRSSLNAASEHHRFQDFCEKLSSLSQLKCEGGQWRLQREPLAWAHGGGIVDGLRYTNSKEAIEAAISNGFRVIEVDVSITSDGVPVLSHFWQPNGENQFDGKTPSLKEFMGVNICDQLTPLSLSDLFAQYDQWDGWFSIDPPARGAASGDFDLVEWMCENLTEQQRRKVIYQIYLEDDLARFAETGSPFGALHYCADPYARSGQEWKIALLAPILPNIGCFSVSYNGNSPISQRKSVVDTCRASGLVVSVFGVNTISRYKMWKEAGASCINTDSLIPKDLVE